MKRGITGIWVVGGLILLLLSLFILTSFIYKVVLPTFKATTSESTVEAWVAKELYVKSLENKIHIDHTLEKFPPVPSVTSPIEINYESDLLDLPRQVSESMVVCWRSLHKGEPFFDEFKVPPYRIAYEESKVFCFPCTKITFNPRLLPYTIMPDISSFIKENSLNYITSTKQGKPTKTANILKHNIDSISGETAEQTLYIMYVAAEGKTWKSITEGREELNIKRLMPEENQMNNIFDSDMYEAVLLIGNPDEMGHICNTEFLTPALWTQERPTSQRK